MKNLFTVILLLLTVGVVGYLGLDYLTASGMGVLSMSEVTFRSTEGTPTSAFWTGKLWMTTVVQNGMGQDLYGGKIDTATLSSTSGEDIADEFRVTIDYGKQTCESSVETTSTNYAIKDLVYHSWTCLPTDTTDVLNSAATSYCNSLGYTMLRTKRELYTCGVVCEKTIGYVGQFKTATPYVHSTGVITVVGKTTETETFDSLSSTNGYVGDLVYYTWDGDLQKTACPVRDVYTPFWNGLTRKWQMTTESSINLYIGELDEFDDEAINLATFESHTNQVNDAFATILGMSDSVNQNFEGREEMVGAKFIQTPSTNVVANVMTLYINSDFLGVYQKIPNLEIETATCANAIATNTGYIDVVVTNQGEEGCATLTMLPNAPFYPETDNERYVCLDSGQTDTERIYYNVDTTTEQTRQITLRLSGTQGVTTKTTNCKATPLTTCDQGTIFCQNNIGYSCNINTGENSVLKQCSSGTTCTVSGTNIICKQPGCTKASDCNDGNPNTIDSCLNGVCQHKTNQTNATCEDKCPLTIMGWNTGTQDPLCYVNCKTDEFFRGVFEFTTGVIKVMATVIASLVGMFISKSVLYNNKKGKKNNNLEATIISILLGLLIGFGVWLII